MCPPPHTGHRAHGERGARERDGRRSGTTVAARDTLSLREHKQHSVTHTPHAHAVYRSARGAAPAGGENREQSRAERGIIIKDTLS